MANLLVGTTFFALLCAALVVLPAFVHQIAVGAVWIAAGGWAATGIVCARGSQQAFCIGAGIVYATMWTGIGGRFIEGVETGISLVFGGPALGSAWSLWLQTVALAAAGYANGRFCAWCERRFFASAGIGVKNETGVSE